MSAYLEHHGIKGQKWGVRRYQNEDGSLTAAGRKHLVKNASDKDILASRDRIKKYEESRKKINDIENKQMNRFYDMMEENSDLYNYDNGIPESKLMKDKEYARLTKALNDAVKESEKFLKYDLQSEIALSKSKLGKEKTQDALIAFGSAAIATLTMAAATAMTMHNRK